MTKKINVCYVRCSSDSQDVQHQLNSINKYAEANNIVINEVIKDEGISAYTTKAEDRKGLMSVLQLAEDNKLDKLIVFESSSLSRNFEGGINIISKLTTCGVKVYSVQDNSCINQNDFDKLMNSFRYFMNEKSSKKSSARIKSAKRLSKEKGLFMGGPIPYGFKVEEKRLTVNEFTVNIIKELYRIYISKSCHESIEYINKFTVMYTTNQTLLHYMSNPRMKQIVGDDLYHEFIRVKSQRKPKGEIRTNRTDVILEGLLYHPCGNKLTIDYDRKGKVRFRCRHCKAKKINDYKKTYTGEMLIANIENEIVKELDNLDKDKLMNKYNSRTNTRISIIQDRLNKLENDYKIKNKEYDKANANLKTILTGEMDMYVIKVVSNTIKMIEENISNIKEQIEIAKKELNNEKVNYTNNKNMVDRLSDIKYLYSKANNEQKKIILNQIIDKIEVRDIEDFDIYFRF